MRIWHKGLISVLPKQQLVAQWRELLAIKGAIEKKGTPNHILVNKVMEYDYSHLLGFAEMLWKEFDNRGYKCSDIKKREFIEFCGPSSLEENEVYKEWHNKRYLDQCYYNLEEKADCGGMSREEYLRLAAKYIELLEGEE